MIVSESGNNTITIPDNHFSDPTEIDQPQLIWECFVGKAEFSSYCTKGAFLTSLDLKVAKHNFMNFTVMLTVAKRWPSGVSNSNRCLSLPSTANQTSSLHSFMCNCNKSSRS